MEIIFETNPILSFFRKHEAIFSVLALFTVFFGILFNKDLFKSSDDPLLYTLLFIYLLLVILYGVVIFDGFSIGLKKIRKVQSFTEKVPLLCITYNHNDNGDYYLFNGSIPFFDILPPI